MTPALLLSTVLACRTEMSECKGTPCTEDSGPADADADGFTPTADCNEADASVNPGAAEIPYDGIDQDCSGSDLTDVDGDGDAALAAGGADCDDEDPTAFAGAVETPYDGVDQDCDGVDLVDVDGDGDAATVAGGTDCDDGNPDVHPEAGEDFANGVDDDCDGTVDEITVCGSGGGDFLTIQEGVDAADGGTVEVCSGEYFEEVELPDFSVTLRGLGAEPSDVLVNAGGGASAISAAADFTTQYQVENLSTTGSTSVAISLTCWASGSLASLRDIEVFGLTEGTGVNLECHSATADGLSVHDNTNEDPDSRELVRVSASRDGTISHMSLLSNTISAGSTWGVVLQGVSVRLVNSLIAENAFGAFVLTFDGAPLVDAVITNNTFAENTLTNVDVGAIMFLREIAAETSLNIRNNVFAENSGFALYLYWDYCDANVSTFDLDGAFEYNLVHNQALATVLNPATTDCEHDGCTCWGYGSDAVDQMFWTSETNLATDPLFVDSSYHISASSPAADAGDPAPEYDDADGTRSDMGRYGGPSGEK